MNHQSFIFPTILFVLLLIPVRLIAQDPDLRVLDWEPQSQLVTGETEVLTPRYPVIDIHNHLRDLDQLEKIYNKNALKLLGMQRTNR